MCVIAWAWQAHSHWPLVMLANRDERHTRASAALDWWDDAPQTLAGRDLEAGGTWLGVTRTGRFAALTNRDGVKPIQAASRGELVTGFLGNGLAVSDQAADLVPRGADYAGFNLLIGDGRELACLSNRDPQQMMLPGIHGMANGALDETIPKVARLKQALADWNRASLQAEDWLALLADDTPAEDDQPRSAIFVRGDLYGTRSSSIVAFGPQGRILFMERSFAADGRVLDTRQFEFERIS